MYILTPAGIKSKMQLSRDFLKRKLELVEKFHRFDKLKHSIRPIPFLCKMI
jgi:hypothetical protein